MCKSIFEEAKRRRKDSQYIKYIRQSNTNCNYLNHVICCPNNQPHNAASETSTNNNDLPEPSQNDHQCGISKTVVNGLGSTPAKKGEKVNDNLIH